SFFSRRSDEVGKLDAWAGPATSRRKAGAGVPTPTLLFCKKLMISLEPGFTPDEIRSRPWGRPPAGPLSMLNPANPSGGKNGTAPADLKSRPVEIRPRTWRGVRGC